MEGRKKKMQIDFFFEDFDFLNETFENNSQPLEQTEKIEKNLENEKDEIENGISKPNISLFLKKHFGFSSFRKGQEEIIFSLLNNQDKYKKKKTAKKKKKKFYFFFFTV